MSAFNTDKISRFIKRELEYVPPCDVFKLRLVGTDGFQESLATFRVPERGSLVEQVQEVVQKIDETSKTAADAANHIAKFRIDSFIREAPAMEGGKWTLSKRDVCYFLRGTNAKTEMMARGMGETASYGESEPPTPVGQVAMAQRHLEATQKMLLEAVQDLTEHGQMERRELRAENSELRKQHNEFFQEREIFLGEKHKRAMSERQLDGAERRKDLAVNAIATQLVPALLPMIAAEMPTLLAKILGKPMPTADASAPAGAAPGSAPPAEDKFKNVQSKFLELDEETRNAAIEVVMKGDPKKGRELLASLGL